MKIGPLYVTSSGNLRTLNKEKGLKAFRERERERERKREREVS